MGTCVGERCQCAVPDLRGGFGGDGVPSQELPPILHLLNTGFIRLAFDLEANHTAIAELAERYADHRPDLADLCLIRMSELHPRHSVITVDGDFRVYRRFRQEAIPLIMPPDSSRERNGG